MVRPGGSRVCILFAIATLLYPAAGRAADTPAEQLLAKAGLKRVGSLYVLDAESDAKKKLEEVRQLSKLWNHARLQQASIGTARDHQVLMQDLNLQINQIRAEIAAVNQEMGRLPRFRNRFASSLAQEQYAELTAYRNQLNLALNQQHAFLNQVRSRPPDPQAGEEDRLRCPGSSRRVPAGGTRPDEARPVDQGEVRRAFPQRRDQKGPEFAGVDRQGQAQARTLPRIPGDRQTRAEAGERDRGITLRWECQTSS